MLVDMPTIKAHLRVTDTSEDTLITIYAQAAEEWIVNFIDGPIPGPDKDPPEPVPFSIKAASLLIVGDLYEIREAQIVADSINPNQTVRDLLYPYRVNLGV